jgi:hypothetical protein
MISEEKRQALLKQTQVTLKARQSTLSALRYETGKGKPGIVTECASCGRTKKMPACYWKSYDCLCTRSSHIAETRRYSEAEVAKWFRKVKVSPLEKYQSLNTAMKVQCLRCDKIWKAWPLNIKKGHACAYCARKDLKKRNLKLYGVENQSQRPEVVAKRKKTMLKRYGVEHALQDKEFFEKNLKSSFTLKPFKLGRRTVHVQGYEDKALAYILSKGVPAKDIECGRKSKIPSIPYVFKGKKRVYHPDIYVPNLNRIFEVKGQYTYNHGLALNLAKQKACEAAGYKFTFLIMDGHGNRIKP